MGNVTPENLNVSRPVTAVNHKKTYCLNKSH